MSSKSKGNEYERQVQKQLEAEGWSVFRVHRKPLFIQGRMVTVGADIFGCDIVARKVGEKTRWIQVGVEGHKARKEAELRKFPCTTAYESVEIWLRVHGKRLFRRFVADDRLAFQEKEPVKA